MLMARGAWMPAAQVYCCGRLVISNRDRMPGDKAKMHRLLLIAARLLPQGTRTRIPCRLLISLAVLGLLWTPGCLFRKHKAPAAPALPAPVRIVLLPLNVPQGKPDLQWLALATTVMMADASMAAPDLEPVPVWESVPAALQSLGNARTVTVDLAALVAARLSARWSVQGDVSVAANGFAMRMDFIPAKPSLVPFRYEKLITIDGLDTRFEEAFDQFLRYLIVRPLAAAKMVPLDAKRLREVSEALDLEYGWFVTAKPGAGSKVVEDLAHSNPGLARLLFSPTMYPVLGK
jgi:hypothetical protein